MAWHLKFTPPAYPQKKTHLLIPFLIHLKSYGQLFWHDHPPKKLLKVSGTKKALGYFIRNIFPTCLDFNFRNSQSPGVCTGSRIRREPVRLWEQVRAGDRLAQGRGKGGGGRRHLLLRDEERTRAQHTGPGPLGLQGGRLRVVVGSLIFAQNCSRLILLKTF